MTLNRAQLRAMKRKAPAHAAHMAACCFTFLKDGMKPGTHPQAVATLTRAFRRLIEAGGRHLACRGPAPSSSVLGAVDGG